MKVIRLGTAEFDGKRLRLNGWRLRIGVGEDYPGDASDFTTERGVRALTAILIHIAARHGIELEEVERDHALHEPLFAEKVMRDTLARAKAKPPTFLERLRRFVSIAVRGA